MKKDLLVYLNTYNRTETLLPLAILSVLNQTYKPDAFVIFDENKEFKNPLENSTLKYLLDLAMEKGIQWFWLPGQQKGAHFNHETANMMGYKYAFFIDDDNVLEPTVIEELMKEMKDDVGAVGGLIMKTPTTPLPEHVTGKIDDVFAGENIAWHAWSGEPREVEHLYSGFLYRCNIVHHDLRLSKKVFRGETMFTHSLFLKGYKLIVTPKAITWHFESQTGGCRTPEENLSNQEMYNADERIFRDWLAFKKTGNKIYVLDNGVGDHYMFRQVIKPDKDKSVIACCYPSVFPEYDCVSIAEAQKYVDKKDYDIYRWYEQNNWKGHLKDAFKKMYEDIDSTL